MSPSRVPGTPAAESGMLMLMESTRVAPPQGVSAEALEAAVRKYCNGGSKEQKEEEEEKAEVV